MKKILLVLRDFASGLIGHTPALHNDNVRASQYADPRSTFSYWRALVS